MAIEHGEKPAEEKRFQVLLFSMGEQRFALSVLDVERVLRAVRITPLPDSPNHLLGLIDIGGQHVPIIDLSRRLGMETRAIDIDDRIIITGKPMRVGFFVSEVTGVVDFDAGHFAVSEGIFPQLEQYLIGVGKWRGETILVFE